MDTDGISLSFFDLYCDLICWGDGIKAKWANDFWGAPDIAHQRYIAEDDDAEPTTEKEGAQ